MPSSNRKKQLHPKKNLGVSVKRKSSTSPSKLYKSPTTKEKIEQNSPIIKSPLRSYNLRNSCLSNPVNGNEVTKFDSSPTKTKDQAHVEGSVKKVSNRCLWCNQFIPADSADSICFSCHFKDSESRAYYGSRRRISRRFSDEPEVIAIVPASPPRKEVSSVNRRNRRKRRPPQKYTPPSPNGKQTASGRQSVNREQIANGKRITNGEASVPLTLVASKLTSGVAKPMEVKMASKRNDKRKFDEVSTPRKSKKAKEIKETSDESESDLNSKSPRNSKRAKEIKETSDESKLNSKSAKPAVGKRSKSLNSHLSEPLPDSEVPSSPSINSKSKVHSAKKASNRCLWCNQFIPADSANSVCFNCQIKDLGIQGFQQSLFQSREEISKNRRSTDFSDNHAEIFTSDNHVERSSDNHAPSLNNHVEKDLTEEKKKTAKSPAVKRKRMTYECNRCGKYFGQQKQFLVHDGRCRDMVSVNEDSESTLSNYSVTEFGVHLEENPILNGSDKVEENVTIHLDNFPSERKDEVSSESADALPAQEKVGENNSLFHKVTTNEESFCLPDTQGSFNTVETISEETVCFDVETFLEVETSSLDLKKTNLEMNEQHSNSKDFCLDAIEPSLDSNDPSLDDDESSLDDTETPLASCEKLSKPHLDGTEQSFDPIAPSVDVSELSLDSNEPSLEDTEPISNPTKDFLNATEPTSDPTKVSMGENEPTLDAYEPTSDAHEPTSDTQEPTSDAQEPTSDAQEPISDANEPTLEAQDPTSDAQDPTSDAQAPTLDANELFLNVIDTSLDNTQPSSNATEPPFSSSTEHSLDAIEPSLDTSGSCLYLEESFLNPEVSNLGATVQISDANDDNVVEHCLGIVESSLDDAQPILNETGLPSQDATPLLGTSELHLEQQNPIVASLNANENCSDAIDSCTVVAKSDLDTAKLHLDASKTELAVDEKDKMQLDLEGSEISLQLQNCCLEREWKTCFKEPDPSLKKLATISKVPEGSLQDFKGFFEERCNSKNTESNVECTLSLQDPKINLEGLKETQFLESLKSSVEVDSAAAKSESNEIKSTLNEAEAIVEENLEMDFNLGGEKLVSKIITLNLEQKSFKDQESSFNVEECTLKQKEYCVAEVENQDQIEEIDISQDDFCIQITNVCSLLDNSKVEPEAKVDISPCSVSKPFTNDSKTDSSHRNNNTMRSERLSRQVPPPPKWENSGLRKGKRKPEDSISGKEAVWSHRLAPSPHKSLGGGGMLNGIPKSTQPPLLSNGMSQGCHSCGKPLSFPAPSNSKTKAEVLDRNLCFSSETVCRFCLADQKIQFSLPTKALDGMFDCHMSSFVGRMERMTHRNFKQMQLSLMASAPQVVASSGFASRTLNSTGSDSSLDSRRVPPCTYPSCTPPPSPYSCPGSVAAQEEVQPVREEVHPVPEEVQPVQEEAQEVLPPREIELTEHDYREPDVVKKRTEDTYTCTRFMSTSCVLPLRRTDIASHYFNVHDSPAGRTTFYVLHVDE